jgi:hypothetical protein
VYVSYLPEMKMVLLTQNPAYQHLCDHLPIQNLKMMTVVEFLVESEVSSARGKHILIHLLSFNPIS